MEIKSALASLVVFIFYLKKKGREGCGILDGLGVFLGCWDHRSEVIIFIETIVGVVNVYYHKLALSYFEDSFQERSP
jgi:hypothetical protein